MIIVSCLTKLHSFNLAEQLDRQQELTRLYTGYSYYNNKIIRPFVKRVDKEKINPTLIKTNIYLAAKVRFGNDHFSVLEQYDNWVAKQLTQEKQAKVFIGWSGMSYQSIRKAKEIGILTILERGSSHIENQIAILEEEYPKYGLKFQRNQDIMDKELREYEKADFISVPSNFAAQSFLKKGFSKEKIWINSFGTSVHFKCLDATPPTMKPFKVLYLGSLVIRKGIKYLIEGFEKLPQEQVELWLIGSMAPELKAYVEKHKKDNWKIFGHVNHYQLNDLINQCHIAVQPSLEEGLSMVIPQILSCGLPVIATTNTGAENLMEEGFEGTIIPIRNSEAIYEKIVFYMEQPKLLKEIRAKAFNQDRSLRTWDDYGDDYLKKISRQLNSTSLDS